jgi:ABC-type multidrug transport system permease subunit
MASSRVGKAEAGGGILTILITIIISLLLNITLIAAANNLKKGLTGSDQGYFNLGMLKMASYFKILGILMIVILVFFALAMLVVIMAGASGGFK